MSGVRVNCCGHLQFYWSIGSATTRNIVGNPVSCQSVQVASVSQCQFNTIAIQFSQPFCTGSIGSSVASQFDPHHIPHRPGIGIFLLYKYGTYAQSSHDSRVKMIAAALEVQDSDRLSGGAGQAKKASRMSGQQVSRLFYLSLSLS